MSFLPVGSHLLPQDFQTFISEWNNAIFTIYGSHVGEARKQFQREYPETWAEYRSTFAAFQSKYAAEVEALKAYQEEHPSEAESESASESASESESESASESASESESESASESDALSNEFAEMKIDDRPDEEEHQPQPEPKSKTKRPRSKYINHPNWPSPRAKVFAKAILLRSWPPHLIGRLTHDEALHFLTTRLSLAQRRECSLDDLLAITPRQALSLFFGSGIPPYALRRYMHRY